VHSDLFRPLLDHHGLQRILAVIEEFAWRAMIDWQTRRMVGASAVRCSFINCTAAVKPFLSTVVAHVAVRGIFDQQTAVRGLSRSCGMSSSFIERLPLIIHLAEVDVRL